MGAEDLVLNSHDVVVVEYHINDVFETPFALARQNYYWVTGLPTVYFDGVIESIGGNSTTSIYEEYLPLYEERKAIMSDFSIDIEGANSQLTDYVVHVSVEKVAVNNSSNLKLFFVLTETEIDFAWMNQPTVNYCQRISLPDENGNLLDFSESDILDFTFEFSIDPEWYVEHCEIAVWVQNTSSKEVYQAAKRSLADFGDFPTRDPMVKHIYTPVTLCNNNFEPGIEVVNLGSADLTSLDLVYQIDNEPAQTYSWNGNIPYSESSVISLPEVNLSVINSSSFTVYLENPNGQADEYPYNNTSSSVIMEAADVNSPMTVIIKLDAYPEQTSWEVLNSSGSVLYSGGNYSEPNVFITEALDLGDIDCYTFKIYDSNGDGLSGTGLYKLMYGTTIFQTGKSFGFQDEVQFGVGLVGLETNNATNTVNVFPNPTTDIINIQADSRINQLFIFNHMGQQVYKTNTTDHNLKMDVSDFESGIYFIKILMDEGTLVKQVIVD